MPTPVLHILLAWLLLPFLSPAQELLFTNLNKEVQLPSQECYKILQDKRGYIWFSTDNGLCRYGNGKLLTFDKRNGLPEESVYAMEEDPNGRIWFLTAENRILYSDGDKLHEAPFSKAYRSYGIGHISNPIPFFIDASHPDELYISNYFYSARIDRRSNRVELIAIKRSAEKPIMAAFEKREGHPAISTYHYTNSQPLVEVRRKNRTIRIRLPRKDGQLSYWNVPTALDGNTDLLAVDNQLIRLRSDDSYRVYDFPSRILFLYVDPQKGLWVGTYKNGVFHYPDQHSMTLGSQSLSGYSVTGIGQDSESGIWCSTLEKGIFHCRNKYLTGYAPVPGLNRTTPLLAWRDGRLFASSEGAHLFVFDGSGYEKFTFPVPENNFYSDLARLGNHWIFVGTNLIIQTDQRFRFQQYKNEEVINVISASALITASDGRLFSVNYRNINEITAAKQLRLEKLRLPSDGKYMIALENNELLLGGSHGLQIYSIRTRKSRKIGGIKGRVTGLLRARDGSAWIVTRDEGIFRMQNGRLSSMSRQLSVSDEDFFDITESPDGTIWAGSNRGLCRFRKTQKGYEKVVFTTAHGLPSNEVYEVAAGGGNIWFSTFEGLFCLPEDKAVRNHIGPAIHLQRLVVKNRKNVTGDKIRLAYDQNDLRFTFDILTFKNGRDVRMEYRLDNGSEQKATRVNGNEILLENLNPGTYTLTVYGINNDGIRSPRPEVFRIVIAPPFWSTWWFLLIGALVVATIVLLIVRFVILRIRRREEAKTEISKMLAEYQMTALQAQMNPHFIFNAINTIQGYILEKNEDEAYHYLAKFGKLIRMVLHHSQEQSLLLEDELKLLELYIGLEQLRFDHCFDYVVVPDEGVDASEISVPAMILQPYIENAIWHGLVNLRGERRGKLTLHISRTDDLLHLSITDNGIGREAAAAFRKDHHHRSVGMDLTGERLKILNRIHGQEAASITVTDLYDDAGHPAGTRVEVTISIQP